MLTRSTDDWLDTFFMKIAKVWSFALSSLSIIRIRFSAAIEWLTIVELTLLVGERAAFLASITHLFKLFYTTIDLIKTIIKMNLLPRIYIEIYFIQF